MRSGLHSVSRQSNFLSDSDRLVDLDLADDLLATIPESIAREMLVLPIGRVDDTLHVVMTSTDDIAKQDKLRFLINFNIKVYRRGSHELREAIEHHYGRMSYEVNALEAADAMVTHAGYSLNAPTTLAEPRLKRSLAPEFKFGGVSRDESRADRSSYVGSASKRRKGMFFYTVDEGEKVLVRDLYGRCTIVSGPARIWQGFKTFEQMRQHVAYPGQYLKILMRDGTQRHLPGPAEAWFDRREHESIAVEDGLTLATNEAVVVYGKSIREDGEPQTTRRVFYGPNIFIPQPGEWLHQFSWHASHGGSRGVEKRPHGLKFEKLWLMPDQMYHDVRDVRTADDAVLMIRLMIFFELIDIEKMLNTTHDPIGDFVNAATSDVVEFCGQRTFEKFKRETALLNENGTYTQLLHRASQSGYRINNVVYRGYGAPDSLQKMHDEAIQSRTKLQLEQETERQAQDLEDYKLRCQMERASRRRQEQTNEIEHELDMKRKQAEARRSNAAAEAGSRREIERLQSDLQLQIEAARQTQQREHLEGLKAMGVQLTEYLTQGRADRVIELRGGDSHPHVHLDQKS